MQIDFVENIVRRGEKIGDWTVALGLWTALGFGVGHYYVFTGVRAQGWPLPTPEILGGAWLSYAMRPSASFGSPWLLLALWIFAFPLAGVLWTWALWLIAPRFEVKLPSFSDALRDLSWGAALTALVGVIAMTWGWWKHQGFWWDYLNAAAPVQCAAWVAPAFIIAAVLNAALEGIVLWVWSPRQARGYLGFLVSGIALSACLAGSAGLAFQWLLNMAARTF